MAKQNPIKLIDLDIDELEALSDLMQEKVDNIKRFCRQAKATIKEGVSTPSINKDLENIAAAAVAKRRARLKRINNK